MFLFLFSRGFQKANHHQLSRNPTSLGNGPGFPFSSILSLPARERVPAAQWERSPSFCSLKLKSSFLPARSVNSTHFPLFAIPGYLQNAKRFSLPHFLPYTHPSACWVQRRHRQRAFALMSLTMIITGTRMDSDIGGGGTKVPEFSPTISLLRSLAHTKM